MLANGELCLTSGSFSAAFGCGFGAGSGIDGFGSANEGKDGNNDV